MYAPIAKLAHSATRPEASNVGEFKYQLQISFSSSIMPPKQYFFHFAIFD
jgi:hypothetical protein